MTFLDLILLLFLAFLIYGGVKAYRFYRRIHAATQQFRDAMRGNGGQADSAQRARTTTTDDGETIIDTRPTDEVNKKIFPKDEGEYVDYVEKKD